ncbi:MAG: hypothetical protein HXX17_00115, partial [Geobacteraceae bacterium]|nr:hypothetical protein [Geobacteraceae bacterium]
SGGTGTNAGSYPATVNCAASANYAAASGITAGSFVISQASQTATVSNTSQTYTGSPVAATVTCLGGGTATSILTGGVATQTNAGSYTVTADCPASTNYTAVTAYAAGNFVISPATPTVSITNSPTTYSGLAQTATVACLGGGAATLASGGTGTNAGSYPATVNCAPSANYGAASGISAGSLVISQAAQTTLAVTGLPTTAIYGQSGIVASTTGGSGTGVLNYSASGSTACTVNPTSGAVTITSGTGSCSLSATKATDTNYTAATSTAVSITISQAPQSLSFGTPPTLVYGGATATVSASSSVGLAVFFSSQTPSVCTVGGSTVTTLSAGICTIAADQPGNANYAAATQITQSISVTTAAFTITATAVNTGGTITPAGATFLNYAASQNYTITPDPGYVIVDVRVDGVSVGRPPSYPFSSINAGHTINVVFGPDGVVDPTNTTGRPTITDVVLLLRAVFGKSPLTAQEIKRVDVAPIVNGVPQPDNTIDDGDLLVMLRRVVGITPW